MNRNRRRLLRFAASVVTLPALARTVRAQSYPSRPVRIVLGFPAGGSSDVIGRLLAQWLSERLGQPVVFENRPGAGSNIGTDSVAKAAPDGYTLLWTTSANAINATLYQNLPFDFRRDFSPVAGAFRVPNVMEVHPDVPVKSVPEFIAYAKAHPGTINYASGGIGSTSHMAGELFKAATGVDMHHIPYRGSAPALIDFIAGRVQAMFDLMPASIGYIRAGKLRALAVTTAARSDALPDLPTVADFIPGYEASTWNGVSAPRNTPAEIRERLNREINAGLADARIKARLVDLGATPIMISAEQFGRFAADETDKWAALIRNAGIKAE